MCLRVLKAQRTNEFIKLTAILDRLPSDTHTASVWAQYWSETSHLNAGLLYQNEREIWSASQWQAADEDEIVDEVGLSTNQLLSNLH